MINHKFIEIIIYMLYNITSIEIFICYCICNFVLKAFVGYVFIKLLIDTIKYFFYTMFSSKVSISKIVSKQWYWWKSSWYRIEVEILVLPTTSGGRGGPLCRLMERLLNAENNWDEIVECAEVEGPCECITETEVEKAIRQMKSGGRWWVRWSVQLVRQGVKKMTYL